MRQTRRERRHGGVADGSRPRRTLPLGALATGSWLSTSERVAPSSRAVRPSKHSHLLGLGADTGRDRSDYVRLNVGDVVASSDGGGYAFFGNPSSDQKIGEAPKFVSPDTMVFIREWLEWREKAAPGSTAADAPMLVRIDQKGILGARLSVWGYVDVLKDIMRRVGDGAHVSGNSFQAGLKLDLAAIGTTKVGIANALGFKEL